MQQVAATTTRGVPVDFFDGAPGSGARSIRIETRRVSKKAILEAYREFDRIVIPALQRVVYFN